MNIDETNLVLQIGVKVLIEKQNKYLLLQRENKYGHLHLSWDLPGGRMKPFTTIYENIQRELLEEIGVVAIKELKIINAQDIFTQKFHIVRITYHAKANFEDKNITLNSNEHSAYAWYTKEDLKELQSLDLYVKEIVNNYL